MVARNTRALGQAAWRASRRAGFTLIEMLMVITIMGILMSLTTVAVFKAMIKAKEDAMGTEVAQLAAAVQSYAQSHGNQYPPDMGARPSIAGVKDRGTRIIEHMRYAYTRAATNGNYTAYSTMRNFVMTNYKVPVAGTTAGKQLDLETLDQAEALVFWIGGFPTPVDSDGVPVIGNKLFGFHKDPSQPFRIDKPTGTQPASIWLQHRTKSDYDFDETRLVDSDEDGWWEYIPKGVSPASNGLVPPYVYFDAATYNTLSTVKSPLSYSGYPIASGSGSSPNSAGLIASWGTAVPYAMKVPSATGNSVISWCAPNSFQIICAGTDACYGDMGSAAVRIPISPGRACYRGGGFSNVGGYGDNELDNITNFSDGTLEDVPLAGS